MKRVLLLLPTTGYRNDDFLAVAKKLDVEIVAAANYCHQLAPAWGLADAQSVLGVTGVTITAEPGQIIAPPPDGASYLGFIFARAASPAEAETALRIAHRRLHFEIRPEYPAMEAPAAART